MNKTVEISLAHSLNVIHYIKQWGNHTSLILLERSCTFFVTPEVDGIIGYQVEGNCIVVLGDPLCAIENRKFLINIFIDYCTEQKKRILYFNISKSWAEWLLDYKGGALVEMGKEFVLNPSRDVRQETGGHACSLRNKYKKSIKDGLTVKEYINNSDKYIEEKLEQVGVSWLQGRKGLQAYLFPVNIFRNRELKRWFYAECNGNIVGLLIINQVAEQRWVLNILVHTACAPKGTSEFLIMNVLEKLRQAGCMSFSIGTLPDGQLAKVEGFGKLSTWIAHLVFNTSKKVFNMHERQRYWMKFEPSQEPTFLLFNSSFVGFHELRGIMRVLHVI